MRQRIARRRGNSGAVALAVGTAGILGLTCASFFHTPSIDLQPLHFSLPSCFIGASWSASDFAPRKRVKQSAIREGESAQALKESDSEAAVSRDDLPGAAGNIQTAPVVPAAAAGTAADASLPISRSSFLFQAVGYVVSVGLIYSALTAESNPEYQDKVSRAIKGAVPASGLKVLELGIGEAPNLAYYPRGTTLVGLDASLPEREFRRGVEIRAAQLGVRMSWARGVAEKLPFPAETFDAVVMTKVFCSIEDPEAALREVSRVLRPGGKFGYVEHVAADSGSLLEQQQLLLDPLQVAIAGNCHLHRDTDGLIRRNVRGSGAAGVEDGASLFSAEEAAERYQVWQMWPITQQAFGLVSK